MPPANDAFASAEVLSGASGSTTGDTTGATKETGEPLLSDTTSGASVWYEFTPPSSGPYFFATSGDLDSVLGLFTGSAVNALTLVAQNDEGGDLSTSTGGFGPSRVVARLVAGVVYKLMVDGWNGTEDAFVLDWGAASPPANDAFATRTTIPLPGGTTSGSNLDATPEADDPSPFDDLDGTIVWYRYVVPYDGDVDLELTGTPSLRLRAFTGSALASLVQIASTFSTVTLADRIDGESLVLGVDGDFYGVRGPFSVIVTPPAPSSGRAWGTGWMRT